MLFDDGVGDPEPEAGAFARRLRRGKGVEDSREHVRMDTGPGVEHLQANVRPTSLRQAHGDDALARVRRHRLVRVLDEVEDDLLDLPLVGQDRSHVRELGDYLHAVAMELMTLELEHPLDLILEPASAALGLGPRRVPEEVLKHLRRARRLLDDDVQPLAALDRVVRAHEQELGLTEDGRQAVARLVREACGQLADRRELLALDQLRLGRLEVLELAPRRRVELGVLQGQADLVRARFDERDLTLGERLARPAAERERAEDAPAAADRHAHESVNAFLRDGSSGGRQEIGRLADVRPVQGLAGGSHAADEALADRQGGVDLAQPRTQAAVAAKVQGRAVGRQQMEARDLMPGDVGERVESDAEHLVDVERRADGLADAVQDPDVGLHVDGRRARGTADQLAEQPQPLVVAILEMERIAIGVGAHEHRRHDEPGVAVGKRDGQARRAPGVAGAIRLHLDARGAEVDRGRLPLGAVLLANANRQRDDGPRRPPTLARGLNLAAWVVRLEARQRLLQAPEGDRLSDEIEGAGPQTLLSLALGRSTRDHENRYAQVANRGVLEEVEAAHSRQAYVQEDGVRLLGAERVERGLGVVRDNRLVADLLEELPEDLADRLIVVDDQYAHRVGPGFGATLFPAIAIPAVGSI